MTGKKTTREHPPYRSAINTGFILTLVYIALNLSACTLLRPLPQEVDLATRLAMFPTTDVPLKKPARILWDDHHIPFIVAGHNDDLAFLMGMVHSHLRLGQMELLRHLARGQLSGLLGPLTTDIDHTIRLIDITRAVPRIEAQLPPETRHWVQRYCAGINYYRRHATTLPPELDVLGITREADWLPADVLAVGRLAAADVNWLFWFLNLRLHTEPGWPALWQRLKAFGKASPTSFEAADGAWMELMASGMKSGSNAVAVAGNRTAGGGALLASDPHLGLSLPNFWVLMGAYAPGYHMVGLTVAGLPVVLVGRNHHVAWGGTNMLALSSTLYDISASAVTSPPEDRNRLNIRWWFDRRLPLPQSPLGPVISAGPFLKTHDLPPLALKWRGHLPSDELTAFLKLNRATDWTTFRNAFKTYAVSGQNMLYADIRGNIGQLLAVEYAPAAGRAGQTFLGDPANADHIWQSVLSSVELPVVTNPARGFLVSCNNLPVRTDPPLALFANSSDRFRRMTSLLTRKNPVTVHDLKRLQTDVWSEGSFTLARGIVRVAGNPPPSAQPLLDAIARWDGHYTIDSHGAAALEILACRLATRYYRARYGEAVSRYLLRSPAVYNFLLEDLGQPDMPPHLTAAIKEAVNDFKTHPTWGDLHQLMLAHPLGRIPLIGAKFRFGHYPVPGSTNTVMKSAHALDTKPHQVTYGANARFISDLSDPDENYFSLLGGQDGFWGSDTFLDLFELWQRGAYVRIPLRLEAVRTDFKHRLVIGAVKTQ